MMQQQETPLQQRSGCTSTFSKLVGLLLMLAGTVLTLLGGYGSRLLFESSSIPPEVWLFLACAAIGLILGGAGWRLFRRGKRLAVISAEELLSKDRRAPVVYIRSFRDDEKRLTGADKTSIAMSKMYMPVFAFKSQEETIAHVLSELGPFVAIGNPKEHLPELGAARMYFSDEAWQAGILGMMQKSKITLLLVGSTPNLWWELEQAIRHLQPAQLLCIELFEKGVDYQLFEQKLEALLGKPGAISKDPSQATGMFSRKQLFGRIIYFDQNWTPKSELISALSPAQAFYNNMINKQFEPALRIALRSVFSKIGLPGPSLRVNKIMVLIFILLVIIVLLLLFGN